MTNYREILRLSSLGILKQNIAVSCGCSRNTVANVIKAAEKNGLGWENAAGLNNNELAKRLFPSSQHKPRLYTPNGHKFPKNLERPEKK